MVQLWAVQRVKDPDRFLMELDREPPGVSRNRVTAEELDRDAASFMAFTGVVGIGGGKPAPT